MKWQNGWQQWEAMPGAMIDVFHWSSAAKGPAALVIAGIHGDEYEGPAAISRLAASLNTSRLRGSLTAVPVANPSAFASGTRLNPDGLNLARCFPGDIHGHPTNRLAAALFETLAAPAEFLIDLHSGGVEYLFLPVAGFYGEPSPANASFAAARGFGLPSLWKLPETTGVLSWEAARRGTVAIGSEYLGAGQLSPEGATQYERGIGRCLALWGLYEEPLSMPGEQKVLTGDWQLATQSGIFHAEQPLGARLTAGQRIAHTESCTGAVMEEFFAPVAAVLGGIRSKAYIRAEDWAVLTLRESHAG